MASFKRFPQKVDNTDGRAAALCYYSTDQETVHQHYTYTTTRNAAALDPYGCVLLESSGQSSAVNVVALWTRINQSIHNNHSENSCSCFAARSLSLCLAECPFTVLSFPFCLWIATTVGQTRIQAESGGNGNSNFIWFQSRMYKKKGCVKYLFETDGLPVQDRIGSSVSSAWWFVLKMYSLSKAAVEKSPPPLLCFYQTPCHDNMPKKKNGTFETMSCFKISSLVETSRPGSADLPTLQSTSCTASP